MQKGHEECLEVLKILPAVPVNIYDTSLNEMKWQKVGRNEQNARIRKYGVGPQAIVRMKIAALEAEISTAKQLLGISGD